MAREELIKSLVSKRAVNVGMRVNHSAVCVRVGDSDYDGNRVAKPIREQFGYFASPDFHRRYHNRFGIVWLLRILGFPSKRSTLEDLC